jgi:hypothetical protein
MTERQREIALHLARADADGIAALYKRLAGGQVMSPEGVERLRQGLGEPEPK